MSDAEADERRAALLEAAEGLADVGSWEWTPAEGELLWSENLFRIFGLEPGEITPSPDYVFAQCHPDDRDRVTRVVAELRESGELRPLDYRIVRPDGVLRHLHAILAAEQWRDGRPYRMVGRVRDLSNRCWANRELAAHVAVTEALVGWSSLEHGAQRLLAALADALDLVAGVLWLPNGDLLVPRVLWTADGVDLKGFMALTLETRLPRGVDVAGQAWEWGSCRPERPPRRLRDSALSGGSPRGPSRRARVPGHRLQGGARGGRARLSRGHRAQRPARAVVDPDRL